MWKTAVLIFCILFCNSCATFNKDNPYPNMETLIYDNNIVYEFKSYNTSSSRLIIDFAGSGWGSNLGLYVDSEWRFTGTGAQLLQVLRKDHTIVIPEKWNRIPGINYIDNPDARYQYTKENLVECYVSSIDSYLAEKNYSSIVLIGTSEGAALLPLVYERMKNKDLVKGIVSIASGGLSIYESYLINIKKENVPEFWRRAYSHALEINENITEYSESIETTPLGLVYRQMASFMNLRAFEYYQKINIPILFIHGEKDMNIAVESTRYVQDNLPEKPFEFIYYKKMEHIPIKYFEVQRFRNDIAGWVKKIYTERKNGA